MTTMHPVAEESSAIVASVVAVVEVVVAAAVAAAVAVVVAVAVAVGAAVVPAPRPRTKQSLAVSPAALACHLVQLCTAILTRRCRSCCGVAGAPSSPTIGPWQLAWWPSPSACSLKCCVHVAKMVGLALLCQS
jgi:hypothetical protein